MLYSSGNFYYLRPANVTSTSAFLGLRSCGLVSEKLEAYMETI